MPSNIGAAAYDMAFKSRGKCLVNLIAIRRLDGVVLRFTDNDRNLTIGQYTFKAVSLAAMDDESRRSGLVPSEQRVFGLVEGTNIQINDLAGGRYRGATLWHSIIDRRVPHLNITTQRKQIVSIKYTRTGWLARVRGLTQKLDTGRGGRFNGVFSPICPYLLGGEFCKKDISPWINAGIQVSTVVSPYSKVETSSARWRSGYTDDFFREGEIEWIWSTPTVTGSTTSAMAHPGTLTDTTKSWTANEHVGKYVRLLDSAGGPVKLAGSRAEYAVITSNTTNSLTFTSLTQSYGSGTQYDICGACDNNGVITPIAYYVNSTRQLELFFPTPSQIQVGDSGIVRPGCDGLKATCKTKYGNLLNHGGTDVDAPTAGEIIKTPEDS